MELLCLWNQLHSDRAMSRDRSGNQMVRVQFKRPWLGHDKSLYVCGFFADQHQFQTFSKTRLTVKVILTHNRKLSILHLFALIIQFLSFPHTASFAFSISGVYFLFEDRVTAVIPFVPLLPNSRNKCFLHLGFQQGTLQRIQPDLIQPKPQQSYSGSIFHDNWTSEHFQRNTLKSTRDVSHKLKPACKAQTASEAENMIWTDKQPSGFIDPGSQINTSLKRARTVRCLVTLWTLWVKAVPLCMRTKLSLVNVELPQLPAPTGLSIIEQWTDAFHPHYFLFMVETRFVKTIGGWS